MFKSKAKQTVELSYIKTVIESEKIRQEYAYNRKLILDDNFHNLVKEELHKIVKAEINRGNLEGFIGSEINVMSEIIDQLGDIYLDDPKRELRVDGKPLKKQDSQADFLLDLYRDAEVNQRFEIVNEYLWAVNEVLIMPVYRNDRLEIQILTPNVLTVITDPEYPTKLLGVIIESENQDDKTLEWIVWTETEHYKLDSNKNQVAIVGNEEMVNPFGALPFVILHRKSPDGDFWNPKLGDDMFQATLKANVRQTLLYFFEGRLNKKQPVIATDDEDSLPDGIITGIDVALITPAGSEVQIADLQVKLTELNDSLDRYVSRISKRYGISTSDMKAFIQGQGNDAGIALKIKGSKLERFRKKQLKIFRKSEEDLFNLIKLILKVRTGKDFSKYELYVTHASIEQQFTEKEKLEIAEKEISLNIKDPVDLYIERNPDFKDDREEALNKIKEIIETKNTLNSLLQEPLDVELNKGEDKKE